MLKKYVSYLAIPVALLALSTPAIGQDLPIADSAKDGSASDTAFYYHTDSTAGDTINTNIGTGTATSYKSGVSHDTNGSIYIEALTFTDGGQYGEDGGSTHLNLNITNSSTDDFNSINLTGITLEPSTVTFKNYGNITLVASAGNATADSNGNASYGNANAYAKAYGVTGDIGGDNAGQFNVTANAGNATTFADSDAYRYANAYADAYGVKGDIGGDNAGQFNVTANAGNATADSNAYANANAKAYGVKGDIGGNNTGCFNVTANAGSAYADAYADGHGYPYAAADAYGVYGDIGGDNTGDFNITANAGNATTYINGRGDAYAKAYGVYGDIEGDNTGDFNITANAGNANADGVANVGAYAKAYGVIGDIGGDNTGDFNVKANAGHISTDSGTSWTSDYATAIGINEQSSNLFNIGSITVTAAQASGSFEWNGDTITGASNNDPGLEAIGILFNPSADDEQTNTLTSTNLISAQILDNAGNVIEKSSWADGQRAYQVFVQKGTTTVDGYAIDFTGTQETINNLYKGRLSSDTQDNDDGSTGGGVIKFGSNATLYAYGTPEPTTFAIPYLIEGSTSNNYFTTVDVQYLSIDSDVYLGTNDTGEQIITFDYAPEASAPLIAAQVTNAISSSIAGIANGQIKNRFLADNSASSNPTLVNFGGALYADNNMPMTGPSDHSLAFDNSSSVFLLPYASKLSSSASPMGYDATIYGFSAGYNKIFNEDFIAGFNAGFGSGDIDYTGVGYDLRSEDVDVYSVGVQALYSPHKDWFFDSVVNVFYTENDYQDVAISNFESANYNTYGADAELILNRIFWFNNSRIIPSIGLEYNWQHNESFTTDITNIAYGDMDDHQLKAKLGADWYGYYENKSGWLIQPTIGVGVEQILTDGEYEVTMTNATVSRSVTDDIDKTSFTAHAGLDLKKDVFGISLFYDGNYSSDISQSSLTLDFRYFF